MFDSLVKNDGEWYVIRVISGTEENVRQSLMQRREAFNLQDFILEVFVPMHDSVSVRAGGVKVKKKRNIFPGYILVKMLVTNESWYIVRNTPNVTGFLGAGTVPVPVRWEELEQLKGVLDKKSEEFRYLSKSETLLRSKQVHLNEVNDLYLKINTEKGVVKIHINLLGRDTPVEIDFANIKAKK